MRPRAFLLLFAGLFLAVALAGAAVLVWWPQAASASGLLSALLLGIGFAILAFRQPGPGSACPRCERALDASLPFCGRCGEAPRA